MESDTNETRYENESPEDISSYNYEQSPSPQECEEYMGGYKPDMDGVTMLRLRKELADLKNEMERAKIEHARLRQDRDEAGGSEMFEDELSGHRVMADPDDSTQESSAWMGKSMGGRGYNQGGEIHTQPQKKEFEVPRATAAVRTEALRRIQAALNQVPNAMQGDANRERTAVTLFAGNLDFTARDADIWNRFSLRNFSLLIVGYEWRT
jgi:hypothetical protein